MLLLFMTVTVHVVACHAAAVRVSTVHDAVLFAHYYSCHLLFMWTVLMLWPSCGGSKSSNFYICTRNFDAAARRAPCLNLLSGNHRLEITVSCQTVHTYAWALFIRTREHCSYVHVNTVHTCLCTKLVTHRLVTMNSSRAPHSSRKPINFIYLSISMLWRHPLPY
jgi:hypothetical protein